jgi:DNA-binding GntR family transcriptional regulator
MDEEFHNAIAALSGNGELIRILKNLNDRIRYVRLINLGTLRDKPVNARMSAHRMILNALVKRDGVQAVAAMRSHIEQRREETNEAVRIAYSQLYVPAD